MVADIARWWVEVSGGYSGVESAKYMAKRFGGSEMDGRWMSVNGDMKDRRMSVKW